MGEKSVRESFWIEAGGLQRKRVRRLLKMLQTDNPGISWEEEKGFLDSFFVVRGPASELLYVHQRLKALEPA